MLGRVTADDFRVLAQAARRCSAADIRVTPWRALIVAGLDRRGAEDLAAALAPRFIVDPADPRLAIVACSGAPACARAARAVQSEALKFASTLPSGEGSRCMSAAARRAAPIRAPRRSRSSRARPAMTWWSTGPPATSPCTPRCGCAISRRCWRVCKEGHRRDDEPRLSPRRRGNLSPVLCDHSARGGSGALRGAGRARRRARHPRLRHGRGRRRSPLLGRRSDSGDRRAASRRADPVRLADGRRRRDPFASAG